MLRTPRIFLMDLKVSFWSSYSPDLLADHFLGFPHLALMMPLLLLTVTPSQLSLQGSWLCSKSLSILHMLLPKCLM